MIPSMMWEKPETEGSVHDLDGCEVKYRTNSGQDPYAWKTESIKRATHVAQCDATALKSSVRGIDRDKVNCDWTQCARPGMHLLRIE